MELNYLSFLLVLGTIFSCVYFYKKNLRAIEKKQLENSLKLTYPPQVLASLVSKPENLTFKPFKTEVTLLAVEIMGLAATADTDTADAAFAQSKDLTQQLIKTVHSFHGVIASHSQEELLCFFNHKDELNAPLAIEQAIYCASKIQLENARQNVAAHELGKSVLPIRTGIHTGIVCIGNRDAYTKQIAVLGSSVQYAAKLAKACEKHAIMISAECQLILKASNWNKQTLRARQIPTEKVGEFLEAYECDPLADTDKLRDKAMTAHRSFTKAVRVHERFEIPADIKVEIEAKNIRGKVLDFSDGGFAAELDSYLAVGAYLNITLNEKNTALAEKLSAESLLPILCEVRWARRTEAGTYLHGLLIQGLHPKERGILFEKIQLCVSKSKSKKAV